MHDRQFEDHKASADKSESDRHSDFQEGLARLTKDDAHHSRRIGARLRNYFFTGLVIVGPVTITIYTVWWFINWVDDWVKPFVPTFYNPDTYLPFPVPGIGLIFAIVGLMIIGALAANLIGRTLISSGEILLGRMPIVRNVYRALKQIFESVVTATSPSRGFQKVGLIEFPSKGIWSIVFVTAEASGEIADSEPGKNDLITVFMPTAIVPPTGFVCFVPRRDIIFLEMTVEDAAKVVISAGMVAPPDPAQAIKDLAARAEKETATATVTAKEGRRQPTITVPPPRVSS